MVQRIRAVGCFMEYDNKFIIVHRNPDKHQGDTWGLVVGKVEPELSDEDSMLKEIREETGYAATRNQLIRLGEWIWCFHDAIIEFVVYRIKLKQLIGVKINPGEHLDFRWVTAKEFYNVKHRVYGTRELLEILKLL